MSPFGSLWGVRRDAALLEDVARDLAAVWAQAQEGHVFTAADLEHLRSVCSALGHVIGSVAGTKGGMEDFLHSAARARGE